MIATMPWQVLVVIALAVLFVYLNGVLDSASLVATAISSRSLSPRWALMLASLAVFTGPFLFGTAVATTIGSSLLRPGVASLALVGAALFGAILWNLIAVRGGMPISSSHALIGGLVGAALAEGGVEAIRLPVLVGILLALVGGPLIGLVAGYAGLRLLLYALRAATPGVNQWFRRAQRLTVVVLALGYGTNDAQKTMGVLLLVLAGVGAVDEGQVPLWVVALSAGGLALGVATGGSRVIRTLGRGFYKMRSLHGFSSQTVAALVILGATLAGSPVSTGQVVSSAIIGVGAAYRLSAVRWALASSIVVAWLVTMPVAGIIAGIAYWLLARV